MRYKVTLRDEARHHELVVFRDFPELEQEGIDSMKNAYLKINEELKGQSASSIVREGGIPRTD